MIENDLAVRLLQDNFVVYRYKGKRYSDNLTAALSKKLEQATSTVREQLSWKSASPDQVLCGRIL